jgi:UDP:flavonoid glycosyltransferase YjiC (YdhE family)
MEPRLRRPLRLLAVTWDGGGNLPPLVGLIEALVAAGHQVSSLAHRTQSAALTAAGARVLGYDRAPERDAGAADAGGYEWLTVFDGAAGEDLAAATSKVAPDVLLIDCMMPATLEAAAGLGLPVVALVHTAWQTLRDYLGGVFRRPAEAAALGLVFSYREFHTGVAPDNFVWVGPARGHPGASSWRRRAPGLPLVLASLSTAQQGQEPVLRNLCQALAALDVEALVTVGRAFDPAALPAGGRVSLERSVPHEHVLGETDLLITHCGHGTTMAALGFGVPILCLPGRGDQPAVAARVAGLGLGEILDTGSSPDAMGAAILRLLADQAMRDRARAFALEAGRHPGTDLAVARIEALAATAR